MKILLILALLLFSLTASALQMLPMDGEIIPGKSPVAEFSLRNSSDEPVAMKAAIYERNPNVRGEEGKHRPIKEDIFEVVKPNIILYPKGDKQGRDFKKFRVYYKGKDKITTEKAYRIIAEQVPVDINKAKNAKNKMRFLAKFVGALYVTPEKAKPKFTLKNVRKTGNRVYFDVINSGNRRDFIEGLKINFSGKDKSGNVFSKTFQKDELKNIYHHTILAGRTRSFFFEIPVNIYRKYLNAQKVTASLD
jgi:fimbrial chaperone protein